MNINGQSRKLVIVVVVTGLIALLHYLTPTEPHYYHKIHIVLRKLYFLPPVMAAAWFGLRGACVTSSIVSFLFILHAFLDWPGNYMEQANQVGELAGFWIVAVIAGWLFDKQRAILIDLANANEETLLALVSALDLREHNTRLHSQRVREYTELLAKQYGIDERNRLEIGFGALLHDVGKIAVPDQILLKPESLTDVEWKVMRKHPEVGAKIVGRIGFLKMAAEIVLTHHERYDGKGYPFGLEGDQIPVGARLFMVADVYDALTSARPYRSPLGYAEALEVIEKEAGLHFDPDAVNAFKSIPSQMIIEIADRYLES